MNLMRSVVSLRAATVSFGLFAAAWAGVVAAPDLALGSAPPRTVVLTGPDGEVRAELPPVEKRGVTDPILEQTVESLAAGEAPPPEATVRGERVVVEVLVAGGDLAAARAAVERLGGATRGAVPPELLQALVPAASIAALESSPAVAQVRAPLSGGAPQEATRAPGTQALGGAILGQEIAKANAAPWHAAGQIGAGVKVGIIDFFDGALWSGAQGGAEVPAPAGTFCLRNGGGCDIWAGKSEHGVAVAEVIHEMAPGAQLYLASAESAADHMAAVDYFASQGVKVISRSLGAEYDGPGNGTGPFASVVDHAYAQGIAWINSAGNTAGRDGSLGGYWRGPWRDQDGDGWIGFDSSGSVELMPMWCGFVQGLRWSDWGSDRTDYDLYFYDETGENVVSVSEEDQRSTTQDIPPLEHLACPLGESVNVAIRRFHQGAGSAGDVLEFQVHGELGSAGLPLHVNPGSATQAVSDSASPGLLSVGAVGDDPLGTAIAPYSSEGPTNDNRIKPDISAATCLTSFAYPSGECANGGTGFNGTSAATPVVTGAAALVLGAGLAATPQQLTSFLRGATVDRGAAGPDNVYGAGELLLPAPPASSTSPGTQPAVAQPQSKAQPLSRCGQAKKALVKANKRVARSLNRLSNARGEEKAAEARRKLIRARAGRVNARARRIAACSVRGRR